MYLRLVAILAALSLVLAGCQNTRVDDVATKPSKVAPRSTAGPGLNTQDQALVDSVWATYLKLNEIYIKAAQTGIYNWDPDPQNRPMYEYAAGAMLVALERDLDLLIENGLVRVGEPKIALRRVVSVSETSILVESCVDDSGTDTIIKSTQKSVAVPGQNKRYPVTLRAGLYPDNLWRWVESHPDRTATC